MWTRFCVIVGGCTAGFAGVQALDFTGDPALGRKLAVTVCSTCHAVEIGGHNAEPTEPPAFQAVADDPAMTEIALRVFLRTPHQDMPDLILTDDETDDVIAYIQSLKRER